MFISLCKSNHILNNIQTSMKNTFLLLSFLIITWLSSCGNPANSEQKPVAIQSGNDTTILTNTEVKRQSENSQLPSLGEEGVVIQLTKAMFLEKVYDFEKNPKQWTFKGDKPCIIDFYADWCRPCKMVAPIMTEFSEKYKGQVIIYKVNTDQERELAQFFSIRSIPTVFFCPKNGDPQMTQGALPKESFEKIITDVLLKK